MPRVCRMIQWFVVSFNMKPRRRRTWAYYSSKADAIAHLQDPLLGEDGYYSHAIIEGVPEGVSYERREETWYELDPLLEVPKPEELEKVAFFSIG